MILDGSAQSRTARARHRSGHAVLDELGIEPPLLKVAMKLERIALQDAYFIEKKLYPKKIGRPRQVYTGSKKRNYVPIKKRKLIHNQ